MKITTDTPAPQPFVPFTINITFESLEEAQKLHNFFNYTPVCQALYKLLPLTDFSSGFRKAISQGLYKKQDDASQNTFLTDLAIMKDVLKPYFN